MNRSSAAEWSGSGIVIESGSPNAVAASAKLTPCLRTLAAAFRASHAKRRGMAQSIRTPKVVHPPNAKAQLRARLIEAPP